jgi:superfamily II DNA or RNA helicase
MPKIIDNIDFFLTKELNENLKVSKRVDCCVGYFNLRGWREIADNIDKLTGEVVVEKEEQYTRYCRLLVGMQKPPDDILRDFFYKTDENRIDNKQINLLKKRLAEDFKKQLTIGTPTETDEIYLRKLSQQIKDGKVVVKLFLKHTLHAKLYLAYSNDTRIPIVSFLGSSNLTFAGLSHQGELNVDVLEQDAAKKLSNWFCDRWIDRGCIDISQELIEIIDNSWASEKPVLPYHIYLKIAYHLSQEARAGLSEFRISKQFQQELLPFQQNAVKIAAHHLNKRGGVMIGDVVGLGKTITATAVAKIFQEDFYYKTLIICPPNLKSMWDEYRLKYDLSAKIISLGEVQTLLPDEKRFKLVIIDESHNLRNSNGKRYRAVKEYLTENESKVILLSATPYNKSFTDIANQLGLFIPDDFDLGISPENYVSELGGAVQFTAKHTETFIRSIKAFEKSQYADDWRELLRFYMVRRTRSFIKNNYAETDPTNNRRFLTFLNGKRSYFPDRIPKMVEYEFNPKDKTDQYAKLYTSKVVDIVNDLSLPRYGLGNFKNEKPSIKPTKDELLILENLSRAGKRLMGFCRTNLFKRLESSGHSFLLSVSRHILRNYIFIYAIENNLPFPIGKQISGFLDDFIEDKDTDENGDKIGLILSEKAYLEKAEEVYKLFETPKFKKQFDWIGSQFFQKSLHKLLEEDSISLLKILQIGKDWNPKDDRQLNALYKLISEKHKDEKVLVFTQFADTAYYLTEQLKSRGITNLECATGDVENPTALAHRFSPSSNNKSDIIKGSSELRVLISTDVLSEGQNLQDAHVVLNYDLPWAIIRLIQRAGRVDRIGQQAERILCYSFLPEDGIEQIIKLRKRLTSRIKDNSEVVGSDETFFDGDPVNIQDIYSEKNGILDEEENDVDVDLASYAFQIWKNATDANPSLKKIIPDLSNVVYSTKTNNSEADKEGTIVYSKTSDDNDILTWVNKKGGIVTQSQFTILKAAECNIETPQVTKLENHHELVKKGIDYIRLEEKNIIGTLGKKTGIKYRVFTRLEALMKDNENTLFASDNLKKSLDEIYKYPLREYAREALGRQLKSGIEDDDLAVLVVSLHEEDKLCIINEEKLEYNEPQIICSLGLSNQNLL